MMQILNRKTVVSIALVIMLTASAFVVVAPSAQAFNSEWNTFLSVMVSPNPIGVNQKLLVTFQLDKVNPLSTIRANLFTGFMVQITKPDNTVENKGPYTAYSMGGAYFMYTPTMEGKYKFQASFPGQWANGSYTTISSFGAWQNMTFGPPPYNYIYENRWYRPSTSEVLEVTVQHDPLTNIQDIPLPTDSWSRPISAENKGWYQLADNWLMLSYDINGRSFSNTAFAPYTSAPDSAHILWKQPVAFGGVVGGRYGDATYYTGLSYEQFYLPLIINGRIIYIDHGPTGLAAFGTRCIDLKTGEDVWYLNNTSIAFAQVFMYDSGNEHGGLPYLWDTGAVSMFGPAAGGNATWKMFDAFSGRQILTVTNITAGTTVFGPKGELLSYSIAGAGANRRLILWNSTLAISGNYVFDTWSPSYLATINGARGIQWNVSIPNMPGSPAISLIGEGYIFMTYVDQMTYPPVYEDMAFAINLEKDATGKYPTSLNYAWFVNRTDLETHWPTVTRNILNGVYARWDQAKMVIHGYSIKTGEELWVTNPVPMGWGIFNQGLQLAYGKLYFASYDGHLRAYDTTNGNLVWDYYMGSAGFENAYGTFPTYGFTIADHKIYITNDEHSPDSIPWRGGKLTVLNTENGDLVWSIDGRLRHTTIADGIATAFNLYDNQIYTFGKGPSKTTVSAPLTGIAVGSSIVIQGMVTDQTPASKDTPAISDASMGAWMAYLHMQKPIPANATGVPVKLTAVDANGAAQDLGTVTSDMSGLFSQVWAPTTPGKYTVIATFEGSDSYDSSFAETVVVVVAAVPPASVPPTSTPPTPPPPASPTLSPSPSELEPPQKGPDTALYVGIATAVIIAVVAAVAIILRRRK
jgi:hypothetical protein